MANYNDMYEMKGLSDPEERLNKPVDVYLIYEDEIDNKKVYKQVDEGIRQELKKKAKAAKDAKEKEKREKTLDAIKNRPRTAPISVPKPPLPLVTPTVPTKPVVPVPIVSKPTPPVPTPVPKPVVTPPPKPTTEPLTPTEPPADDTVNFYWVRHAESVANLYNNKPTDKYPEKKTNSNLKIELRKFLKQDYDNVQKMRGNKELTVTDRPLAVEVKDTELPGSINFQVYGDESTAYYNLTYAEDHKNIGLISGLVTKNNDNTYKIYISKVDIEDTVKNKKLCQKLMNKYILQVEKKYKILKNIRLIITDIPVENTNKDKLKLGKYVSPACLCYINTFVKNNYDVYKFNDNTHTYEKIEGDITNICYNDNKDEIKAKHFLEFVKKVPVQAGGTKNQAIGTNKQAGGATIEENTYPLVDEVYAEIANKVKEAQKLDKYKDYAEGCKSFIEKYKDQETNPPTDDYLKQIFPFDESDENKYKGKQIDPNNSKCIGKLGEEFKAKTISSDEAGKLYALWLQNFIPSNFLFQPTLSQCGMVQARILGEQIKGKIVPDIILTSATVRTMMTAYLAALYAGFDQEIYVVPYLNESENDAKNVFKGSKKNLHDYCNYAIDPSKMPAVADTIYAWFQKNNIYDVAGKINTEQITPSTKINFNLNLYQGGEELRSQDLGKFMDLFDTNTTLNTKKQVLVFSHGYAVDEVRNKVFDKTLAANTGMPDKYISTKLATLQTGKKNTAVFNHLYKNKKYEPIYTTLPKIMPSVEIEEENSDVKTQALTETMYLTSELKNPDFIEELKTFGLMYFPMGETSIREKHKGEEVLPIDKTRAEPLIEGGVEGVEPLTSLERGSLRGDIAFITHGGEPKPPPVSVLAPVIIEAPPPPTPVLLYEANEGNFEVNKDIEFEKHKPTVTPANTNYKYTVDTPFTKGILFDEKTGIISGKPAEGTEGTHTTNITVTDKVTESSSKPFTFAYTVNPPPKPEEIPDLNYESDKESMFQGDPYELKITKEGFSEFLISPEDKLPTGLVFNKDTGLISGSTTVLQPSTEYTVTATYKDTNKTTKEAKLSIAVVMRSIKFSYDKIEVATGNTINAPPKGIDPQYKDGLKFKFVDSPPNDEIIIDENEGTIKSNNATSKPVRPKTYKVQVTDKFNNTHPPVEVYISVMPNGIISFSYEAINGTAGLDIQPREPQIVDFEKASGKIKDYYADFNLKKVKSLPDGLSIEYASGKISGKPTRMVPTTNYTIIGKDYWKRLVEAPISITIKKETTQRKPASPVPEKKLEITSASKIRLQLTRLNAVKIKDFILSLYDITKNKYILNNNYKTPLADQFEELEKNQKYKDLDAKDKQTILEIKRKAQNTAKIEPDEIDKQKKIAQVFGNTLYKNELENNLRTYINDLVRIEDAFNQEESEIQNYSEGPVWTDNILVQIGIIDDDGIKAYLPVIGAQNARGGRRRQIDRKKATRRVTRNKRKRKYTKRRRPLKRNKKTRRIQKKKRKFTKTKK